MSKKNSLGGIILILSIVIISCKENKTVEQTSPTKPIDTIAKVEEPKPQPKIEEKQSVGNFDLVAKDSFKTIIKNLNENDLKLVAAINRVDVNLIRRQDSVVLPQDLTKPFNDYFSFPLEVPALKDVQKMIIFSYPTQTFVAYENGKIKLTGPTSMGKSSTKTPRGLFFTNWKSKKSISTSNSEWILKWNFNIHNTMGVGFHEYQLPGYPASHSCLRLRSEDAQGLYNWADQWVLGKSDELLYHGTPVLVYGSYPFGGRKPWKNLADNPNALEIPVSEVEELIQPHLEKIMKYQNQRQAYQQKRDSAKIKLG